MKTKYYILFVWSCVEPSLKGPYSNYNERNEAARILRNDPDTSTDEDCIFWLDLCEDGKILVGSYTNRFMEGDSE